MLLTIDAGNTNIVFAVYDGEEQLYLWRCETHSPLYPPACEFSTDKIAAVIISSVVPDIDQALVAFCKDQYRCDPIMVSHETVHLKVDLDNPSEVGADRLVNAVAVAHYYKSPAIVVDFGTATTFDIIDKEGAYVGGIIAPGVNLSMEALHMAAAKLPKVDIKKPENIIGTDTVSAMQSGIYWGYVGMIEGTLKRIEGELGFKPFTLATGGLAALFADTIPAIETVDKDLTLRGLLHIYRQQ